MPDKKRLEIKGRTKMTRLLKHLISNKGTESRVVLEAFLETVIAYHVQCEDKSRLKKKATERELGATDFVERVVYRISQKIAKKELVEQQIKGTLEALSSSVHPNVEGGNL
jgi:hypothetical protein